MEMKRGFLLLLLGLSLTASRVCASTGGPDIVEALGWDPVERRAYFTIRHIDESGRMPAVIHFDLGGSSPAQPVQVGWSKNASISGEERTRYDQQLQGLQARLRPLEAIDGPTVFHHARTLEADTLSRPYARFLVNVSDWRVSEVGFEVHTIVEPSVRMLRKYQVPGRSETFGVLSFRAIPTEWGYEAQIPVLLSAPPGPPSRPQPQPIRIEWKRWE